MTKKLTTQEEKLMLVLWRIGKGAMQDILQCYPDPKPAPNTLSTYLKILEEKNYVRHKRMGRQFEYAPIISKFEYQQILLKHILVHYSDLDKSKLKLSIDFID